MKKNALLALFVLLSLCLIRSAAAQDAPTAPNEDCPTAPVLPPEASIDPSAPLTVEDRLTVLEHEHRELVERVEDLAKSRRLRVDDDFAGIPGVRDHVPPFSVQFPPSPIDPFPSPLIPEPSVPSPSLLDLFRKTGMPGLLLAFALGLLVGFCGGRVYHSGVIEHK